jgi:NAD(P)-dependent dehydrogenase (short-subunit alcohol dehydrogenase family)
MTKHCYDGAGAPARELTELIPQQRGGAADEIAAVALFLASDAARYVNGQHLIVDGGLSSSIPSACRLRAEEVQAMLRIGA